MSRTPSPHSGSSSLRPPGPGISNGTDFASWKGQQDPRSSSTQSLLPSLKDGRRTLLVVYLHGFMGNDSSFRSFPAHVHNFLKDALAETHVIHSKVYPRYKTYKAIDVARDNFSKWLEPHESPTTDVVLVGHSMGGLLAADIVLMPSRSGGVSGSPFRHRILGTVSLDAPLLGLHPGIVVSGIASLFRPAPTPDATTSNSMLSENISPDPSIYSEVSPPSRTASPALPSSPPPGSQPPTQDPLFNPPFFNDISFVDRGWMRNIAHFARKHKEENIVEAAAHHIMSHLEFGGCLADYPGLRTRYNNLRKLEDVDEAKIPAGGQRIPRVRFVNYFTASTGLPKKPKAIPAPGASEGSNNALLKPTNSQEANPSDINSGTSTPRISIEDHSESGRPLVLQELEPVPESDDRTAVTHTNDSIPLTEDTSNTPGGNPSWDDSLPPIPDLPTPPEPPNLEAYTDKEARKQAEKEAKRARKIYEQAVKNRERAVKERQKILDKRARKTVKEAEKRAKTEQKEAHTRQKSELKQRAKEEQELQAEIDKFYLEESSQPSVVEKEKKKKEKKFCMLPSKSAGVRDPTWVRVYMEGVDEVGAHCGLFVPGPHYEKLVGDMGSRIVEWVQDDSTRRAIAELS
ncbi:hypothetical protein QBC34DRAFT_394597 [Podospora aff. communis PSN243]|uniref:AB hydrolase-1 domain-containing protein n=1 Tax=Podospora aff. communis PSN243 TaxID=3040156 RepID=A0AAV9GZ43_9PEZI|nr:hypothetical protein QBC34DRAFT_394597 [Podospora aff. communis PSN243]